MTVLVQNAVKDVERRISNCVQTLPHQRLVKVERLRKCITFTGRTSIISKVSGKDTLKIVITAVLH